MDVFVAECEREEAAEEEGYQSEDLERRVESHRRRAVVAGVFREAGGNESESESKEATGKDTGRDNERDGLVLLIAKSEAADLLECSAYLLLQLSDYRNCLHRARQYLRRIFRQRMHGSLAQVRG